jgi:hypothetical protein
MIVDGIQHIFKTIETFDGIYDGQGYTIYNLFILFEGDNNNYNAGMFGTLKGTGVDTTTGIVKNLTLRNAILSANDTLTAGLIAGKLDGGSIENVSVHGSIFATARELKGDEFVTQTYDIQAGGITGLTVNSTLTNVRSYVTINITESTASAIGGTTGKQENTTITEATSFAQINVQNTQGATITVHQTLGETVYLNGEAYNTATYTQFIAQQLLIPNSEAIEVLSTYIFKRWHFPEDTFFTTLYGTDDKKFVISAYPQLLLRDELYRFAVFEERADFIEK